MERRYNSMKRINKGTRLFCKHGVWAVTPLRLRCNIALSILSPFKVSPVLGIREELKDLSISDRDFHALGTIYEPLLGENRELGEKRDSTLRTNTRLI